MAVERVVVYDIDELRCFGEYIACKAKEIEDLYTGLARESQAQASNWVDPQYDQLNNIIMTYLEGSKAQLETLESALRYIINLAVKLKDL